MSKKLYAAFLPLLAMTAFTVMPAMAQAAPHWYSCTSKAGGKFKDAFCKEAASSGTFEWTKTPESERVKVKTNGTVTLTGFETRYRCSVNGKETIENPLGGGVGIGSITELEFSECKANVEEACPSTTVTVLHNGKKVSAANSLPLRLIAVGGSGPEARDEISGMELEIRCKGVLSALVNKGSLTPKIGSSLTEFDSGSGSLEGSGGGIWTIAGDINLEGPTGGKGITAKNP